MKWVTNGYGNGSRKICKIRGEKRYVAKKCGCGYYGARRKQADSSQEYKGVLRETYYRVFD